MDDETLKKLDEISKKLDELTRIVNDNQEHNSSFESRMKQWVMFYAASYLADKTLQLK